MRRESSLLLWALLPVIAALKEAGLLRRRTLLATRSAETVIRLAVWALLIWSLIRGERSGVFGASVAIVGMGLIAIGFLWYANRKGWRKRWLQQS